MNLTTKQKNIINPYAESYNSSERRGAGYDYESESNRFILDIIHESFIYFYEFPQIGTTVNGVGGENNSITLNDMLAYFALYPQNGKVVDNEPVQINFSESVALLNLLISLLEEQGSLEKYLTLTTEQIYQEEYQDNNFSTLNLDQKLAALIAISPNHSDQYRNTLRRSINLPELEYNNHTSLDLLNLDPEVAVYISTDSNVDLYDWRNNALPGEDNDRVYYNPADKKYYYVKRTNNTNQEDYSYNRLRAVAKSESVGTAIRVWGTYSQEKKGRYVASVERGIREILKLTSRNTEENFKKLKELLVPPQSYRDGGRDRGAECFPLLTYKGERPGSRWVYALKLDATFISLLDASDQENVSLRPSQEEFQRSPLNISKLLIGSQNQTTRRVAFKNSDMVRYLLPVRGLLREYSQDLFQQGIAPEYISGINLNKEAERLEGFFEFLELFYSYNKISLQDDDYVEFFFTNNYELDHVAINGIMYYQGSGINQYLNLLGNSTAVVNAFSTYTPTTFSIIKNSFLIYNQGNLESRSVKMNAIEFLEKYIFPKQNSDALKILRQNTRIEKNKIEKRRTDLFTKLSEISNTSPATFEQLFIQRDKKYRISSILSSIDCDTGQANTAKYALKFYQAAYSKTRWRSLIREAVILLRQEVIDDEYTFLGFTSDDALLYGERYADLEIQREGAGQESLRRAAERYINSQINCSLDILGDYIEDLFLDPLGDVPLAKDLTRKTLDQVPTIEFKKGKMISFKTRQSDIYKKAIETILLNYITSIFAGVAKDLLNALLGCGPNSPVRSSRQGLGNALRRLNFGEADLDELASEVDIVQIAKDTPLYVVEQLQVGTTTTVNKSTPTAQQLSDLLSDVSKMVRPIEAQQLLDGDASSELLQHILETITSNVVILPENIDPSRYNSIDFSLQNIRDFFIQLGDVLNEDIETAAENSPLAVYCEIRNTANYDISNNLDTKEVQEQYDEIVQNKINKINRMCDLLKGMNSTQLEIDQLVSLLPDMAWYDDLLSLIADVSNGLTSFISRKSTDSFAQDQTQTLRSAGTYNLYGSKLGTELFYQAFPSMRFVPINQLYKESDREDAPWGFLTPTTWSTEFRGRRWRIRDNEVTDSRNNRYVWGDVRGYIWGRRSGGQTAPRIDIPQYESPQRNPLDRRDIGYYSKRSAPQALRRRLETAPNLLRRPYTSGLKKIDGRVTREPEEGESRIMLSIADRVTPYFRQEEFEEPYNGWTGATFLECGSSRSSGNKKITISYFGPSDTEEYTSTVVAEYDPSGLIKNEASLSPYKPGVNGDFEKINYGIFDGINIDINEQEQGFVYQTREGALSIPGRQFVSVQMPSNTARSTRKLYGNFSVGVPRSGDIGRPRERDEDITSLQNYTKRTDGLIDATVTSDAGKRRMPRYIQSLNKVPFNIADDTCITQEEIAKAKAGVQTIQSRMVPFFLNIMPLADAYPNWGSVGTIQLIVDYLYRKISTDLIEKNILGSFYNTINFINMVFPYSPEDGFDLNPRIDDFKSPEENTRSIIESMYLGVLKNIESTSEYVDISKSIFDPTTENFNKYKKSLAKYYSAILRDRNMSGYGVPGFDIQEATDRMQDFFDGDEPTDLGLLVGVYYMPIAFQVASYMVYYDLGVRFGNRFSDTNYQSLVEIAASDDGLISVLRGQTVYTFSSQYDGFPTSIPTWDGFREITYYNQDQVRVRIDRLDQHLQNFNLSLEQNIGIYNLERLSELFRENEQRVSVEALYPDYFSNDLNGVRVDEDYSGNIIELQPRPWPMNDIGEQTGLRPDTITAINDWFRDWSNSDIPTLSPEEQITLNRLRLNLIQARLFRDDQREERIERQIAQIENQPEDLTGFNYNRTLESSRARVQDENISEPQREGESFWIEILENNYKEEEVDIFTSPDYFRTLSEYFFRVSSSFRLDYSFYLEENNLQVGALGLERIRGEAPIPGDIRRTANVLKEVSVFFIYLAILYRDSVDVVVKVLEEKNTLEKLINNNE